MSILIIGDLILDINYIGSCTRIAPEAPIPITKINNINYNLGGALNIANNLVSMGNTVNIIGVIGNDINGTKILNLLKEKSINTEYIITDSSRPTTTKHRIFCSNKLVSRFDIETNQQIDDVIYNQIMECIKKLIDTTKIIILSDYLKGVLTNKLTHEIITFCNINNKEVFIDPKDSNYSKYIGCTLIKPNKSEGEQILGRQINMDNIADDLLEIKTKLNTKHCLLTLGECGLALLLNDNTYKYYRANQKNVIDVTGAGDTVIAAFTHYYINNNDMMSAADFANYCGQLKVTHAGTYAITNLDIIKYKMRYNKLITQNDIESVIDILKKNNKKIVFTNGCFDVLHYGHMTFLEEAKKLGDILIVGLNSDKSIKRLKGDLRPFNNEIYRIKQLEMLFIVDIIIIFDDDTPLNLIKKIEPCILVKGGDYTTNNIIGKEYAKEVKTLNFIENISTTKILNYYK